MAADDAKRYLDAFDALLVPQGFKRRARSQEWIITSGPDRMWVHLNFGKTVINPSLGVDYLDLEQRWPGPLSAVSGTMRMLSRLFNPAHSYYSDESDPNDLVADMEEVGLPATAELKDRHSVIEMLRSPVVANWPVPSLSHRIRLMPLLLAGVGRPEEAVETATQFAVEFTAQDQLVPGYGLFVELLQTTITT